MRIAKRCVVSGRVQGVFYRASAKQKALELGVTGSARNLVDGRVEVLAFGEESAVEALIDWLWVGSPTSSVANVDVVTVRAEELREVPRSFTTG